MTNDEEIDKLRQLLEEGIEAFRLTREFLGEDALPAVKGWSWFDWCEKVRSILGLDDVSDAYLASEVKLLKSIAFTLRRTK